MVEEYQPQLRKMYGKYNVNPFATFVQDQKIPLWQIGAILEGTLVEVKFFVEHDHHAGIQTSIKSLRIL